MELNKVMLVGNLTRDPEIKTLPSGDAVADVDIAVNRTFNNRQGERQQDVTYVRITVFGKQADFCRNYLQKGKAIYVEGRLRLQSWETQEGQKRSKLDVVAERIQFAYPRSLESGGSSSGNYPQRQSAPNSPPPDDEDPSGDSTEDDLPF
jgi:single-strand DNA-binding protein